MTLLYKATYENTCPECPAKKERIFYIKENAERWLKSFANGKYVTKDVQPKQYVSHGIIKEPITNKNVKLYDSLGAELESMIKEVKNIDDR